MASTSSAGSPAGRAPRHNVRYLRTERDRMGHDHDIRMG
jgi:hypothetical protein